MQSANDDLAPHSILRHFTKLIALATCCLTLCAGASAFGQVLRGQAAMGDWRDDKPGLRRLITAPDLPAVAKPTTGQAQVVPMPPDAHPQLPDGFTAELVTTDTHKPRVIRVAPNGDLFVADSMFGAVRVLRVPAGSGSSRREGRDLREAASSSRTASRSIRPGPTSRWVYVASCATAWFASRTRRSDLHRHRQGPARGRWYSLECTTTGWAIAFSPDGKRLYLSGGLRLERRLRHVPRAALDDASGARRRRGAAGVRRPS